MKRLFLVLLATVAVIATALADAPEKMSSATQVLLSQRAENGGRTKVRPKVPYEQLADSLPFVDKRALQSAVKRANIADIEDINGVEMISAFVRVNNGTFAALEALGAVMQSDFGNGLAAMLLPVDKIGAISDLGNVTYIEVAEVLQTVNDRQRSVTQAGDAIANSAAAQALGLSKQYTGKDVILGIIDTGIDFTHIAFKDKNGNSRIVRAYKLQSSNSTSLTTYSSASQINGLTYDTNNEDHGTHTSTTAGGSSVIVNGTNVTVTDNHANATYGGMAPEADLVLCGLSSLYTTSIGTAIQNICNYADEVGKPCVISLSLGSQTGPHDGTGTIADIVNSCAGNNHIIVYAASNDGMRTFGFDGASGGMYASGTSTSSKPMLVNVQRNFSNADGNVEMLMPTIVAYARTPNVDTSLKFHVVNVNTGEIVYSSSAYSTSRTITVTGSTGLAQYFKSSTQYTNQYGDAGTIRITKSQDASNNKYYWQIYCPIMISQSYADSDGDGVYNSNYAFCVSVYPTNGSTIVDMWESYASWFGTDLNLSSNSYNYCPGNDECSVSDNACYSKAISVGAYVTKNSITDYQGTAHDFSSEYPNIGDHASFSSWQTAGYGPLGTALPHINAPGARIVAGVNHYHTTSVDDYSYYGDDYKTDLVVNSTNYPYAAMEGTSMATPCVSGIIAQWLQACVEAGKTPTPDYIKEVMQNTWDTDQWTNGAGHGAKTFGTHGKINAIKGLQYILGTHAGPEITATPASVTFTGFATRTYTQTVTVTGTNLSQGITASLSGAAAYSIDRTALGASGGTITVTYAPTAAGQTQATLTLASAGASTVTVPVSGTAQAATPTLLVDKSSLAFDAQINEAASETVTVSGRFLSDDVTVTLTDAAGVFAIDKTDLSSETLNADGSLNVTVTFNAADEGDYSGTLTLTSGSLTQEVTLSATATDKPTYVYVLTNTLTAGKEYLIVNGNTAGSSYALGHSNTTVARDAVTVKNDASVTSALFIEADDVDETSVWTAASGVTLKNGSNYLGITTSGFSRTLRISTSSTNWTYSGTNHTLSTGSGMSTYYLRYSSNAFSVSRTSGSIYLYEKQELTPELTVNPTALTMREVPGESVTATVAVSGRRLRGSVTVTLTDDHDVFSVSPATLTAAQAMAGAEVTVTFSSSTEGSYHGRVTLTSGSLSADVDLIGNCRDGGTASDNYLNIAKYATIDEAGASVSGMDKIYAFTTYPSDDVSWLTLSNNGIMLDDDYQHWCATTSLSSYNNSWDATDIFLGATEYFGSNNSKSIYGSGNQVFYVTNCSQVKALVKGSTSSTGTATLAIYECVENSDGTLTASATATDSHQGGNGKTGSPEVIASATLDASKIYMVQLTGGGSYPDMLEIGFCTPSVNPLLTVDQRYLEFIAEENSTLQETITVTGAHLTEGVTVTLTDEHNVYEIDRSAITIAEAEAGATVTVTLHAPALMGTYRGHLTFASEGATSIDVPLYGTVGNKGTAFSYYLDIERYSSIAVDDWYEGLFAKSYHFTEDATEGCSWLTIPGALPYYAWNYEDEDWCNVSASASGGWYGHTWNATDVFQGSEYYQVYDADSGENIALMLGGETSNETTNTTKYYAAYHVTNCTQAKALVYNNSGVSSTYPSFIEIHEITDNGDGTFTIASNSTDRKTSTTSGVATLASANLDASKIYCVYVGGYRGFTYEVAFRTPLESDTDLAEIVTDQKEYFHYHVTPGDLTAVYSSEDGRTLYCKDDNGYAHPDLPIAGDIDYVMDHTTLMSNDYDQSNWVALTMPDDSADEFPVELLGKRLADVKGTITDLVNPTIVLDNDVMPTVYGSSSLTLNKFIIPSFIGEEQTNEHGNTYFFVTPKPMEIATVTWAMWDEANGVFTCPTSIGSVNQADLHGSIEVDFSMYAGPVPMLEDGGVYSFTALNHRPSIGEGTMSKARALSQTRTVYVLDSLTEIGKIDGDVVTGVEGLTADGDIQSVTYSNPAGQLSSEPFDGVNIVIITRTDGSRQVVKKLF